MPNLRYVPVLSEPDAVDAGDAWNGRTGFVHEAVMADFDDLSAHQVYACGAPLMVEAAQRDFSALRGLPEDAFFADAFTSEADKHGAAVPTHTTEHHATNALTDTGSVKESR